MHGNGSGDYRLRDQGLEGTERARDAELVDPELQRRVRQRGNWLAVHHGGLELPLAHTIKRCRVQSHYRLDHTSLANSSRIVDPELDHHPTLDLPVKGFLGIHPAASA